MNNEKQALIKYVEEVSKTIFGNISLAVSVLTKDELSDKNLQLSNFNFICIIELLDDIIHREQINKLSNFVKKEIYFSSQLANKIYWYEGPGVNQEETTGNSVPIKLVTEITLPKFLDDYIFKKVGASYSPNYLKFSRNLDHKKADVIKYLGTYFPRSFAETYSITDNIISNQYIKSTLICKEEINILDIGSGTGGNLSGVLFALCENMSDNYKFNITVIDGNKEALKILERIVLIFKVEYDLNISLNSHYISFQTIPDLYNKSKRFYETDFDFILSSKMINEIIGNSEDSYYEFYENYTRHLSDEGLLLMLDTTTKIGDLNYMPILLNQQTNRFIQNNALKYKTLIPLSCNTNDTICNVNCFSQNIFYVSHSKKKEDKSKVAYRIVGKKKFVTNIIDTVKQKGNVIAWNVDNTPNKFCPYIKFHRNVDSFRI